MIDIAPQTAPYEHFAFDIETTNGRPEEAEAWMRRIWSPNVKWKPATIGDRFVQAFEKKKERLALIDTSPIIAVSIATDRDLRCLHAMGEHEPRELAGGLVEGFASERGMLTALRNLIENCVGPDSILVGHNILRFDLPKLRHAFVRSGLRLPMALIERGQPLFDSMREFGRFSLDEKPFVAVGDLLEIFGVPNHKGAVSGTQIPDLYERGETEVIVRYAMLDVLAEYQLFLRMTGQAADVEPGSGPFAGEESSNEAESEAAPSTEEERDVAKGGENPPAPVDQRPEPPPLPPSPPKDEPLF